MPVFSNTSTIYNDQNTGLIEGSSDPQPPIGKNYYIRYTGGISHLIAKIVSVGAVGFSYILKINGWIRTDDGVASRYEGSWLVSDGTLDRNGIYTGGNGLLMEVSGGIVSITLVENSTYGLTLETRPFVGEDDETSINFDKTDVTKYYKILT